MSTSTPQEPLKGKTSQMRPWQFSLLQMLVATTLVAICVAASLSDLFMGMWVTWGCLFLVAWYFRTSGVLRVWPQNGSDIDANLRRWKIVLAACAWSFPFALGAVIAFGGVCTGVSVSAGVLLYNPNSGMGNAFLHIVVLMAIPAASVVGLGFLWKTWPRAK